jgi:hypothetical protein
MFGKLLSRWSGAPKAQTAVEPAIDLPPEVLDLQSRRAELSSQEHRVQVYSTAESQSYTRALRTFDDGRLFGLVALGNANDSNPYCLITRGVAAGMVMHFFHDDQPMIEFDGLPAFERFLRDLRSGVSQGGTADERQIPVHPRQAELAAAIEDLRGYEDDGAASIMLVYLPMLAGDHWRLLHALCEHESVFVRQAVIELIARGRVTGSGDLLQILVADVDALVRNAARRALGLSR